MVVSEGLEIETGIEERLIRPAYGDLTQVKSTKPLGLIQLNAGRSAKTYHLTEMQIRGGCRARIFDAESFEESRR
jgi:hypothetical protein